MMRDCRMMFSYKASSCLCVPPTLVIDKYLPSFVTCDKTIPNPNKPTYEINLTCLPRLLCIDHQFHVEFALSRLRAYEIVFSFLKINVIKSTALFVSTAWGFTCIVTMFVYYNHIVLSLFVWKLCNIETIRKSRISVGDWRIFKLPW